MLHISWRWLCAVALCFAVLASFATSAHGAEIDWDSMKGVDVMKYTKDVMTNQPGDKEIENIVSALKSLNITHIALSIPLDKTTDYPSSNKPAPRTAEAFTQKWADAIHSAGLNIIWRGTYSGIEGIYDFEKKSGDKRLPAGTAASAETDGEKTWLGKLYSYIISNPSFFASGDVWAPLPERTEGIFQDSTSFLPYDGAGIQANYANFFIDLKKVSDRAFSKIGKNVITGMSANNYSEIASGWLPQSLFDAIGYVVVDYYGDKHTPEEMERDLRSIAARTGKPVFLQEWGDYWTGDMSVESRTSYLRSIYAVIEKLAKEGVIIGFNSWTGWTDAQESILERTTDGVKINYAGSVLAELFAKNIRAPEDHDSPDPEDDPKPPVTEDPQSLKCPGPTDGAFSACYYHDQRMQDLALVRTDAAIDFTWDHGSPDPSLPADRFSARWQGYFEFEDGTYEFKVNSDDGFRLFIDDELILDKWYGQSAYIGHSASKKLSVGKHKIVMEYYEEAGGAVAKLSWSKTETSSPPTADKGFKATYYRGKDMRDEILTE